MRGFEESMTKIAESKLNSDIRNDDLGPIEASQFSNSKPRSQLSLLLGPECFAFAFSLGTLLTDRKNRDYTYQHATFLHAKAKEKIIVSCSNRVHACIGRCIVTASHIH